MLRKILVSRRPVRMNFDGLEVKIERLFILTTLRIQSRKIGIRDFSKRIHAQRLVIEVNCLLDAVLCPRMVANHI